MRLLMCRPEHFDVTYRINPWMHPGEPVDRERAIRQWETLVATYRRLGHTVDLVDPAPGLPDLVFTANAGLVVGDTVLTARYRHPERQAEQGALRRWFAQAGYRIVEPLGWCEGEGDLLVHGDDGLLAGWGYRTARIVHAQAGRLSGRRPIPLRLVDPRYYHLDTAVAVLDRDHVLVHEDALAPSSVAALRRRFACVLSVPAEEAVLLAANAVSDGHHVVLAAGAVRTETALRAHGFDPIPIDLSELRKAGGGAKCCSLILEGAP